MNEIASAGQLRMTLVRWALVMVPLLILLGALSGMLAGSGADNGWYRGLMKPALTPPGWVFGLVWTLLYAMQGLALAIILSARSAPGRRRAVGLFIAQFALNLLWSPLFFGLHQVSAAIWLLIAIIVLAFATGWSFWRIRGLAALLMVPYLLWLCFALFLNYSFDRLNPDAEALHNPVARTHIGSGT